MILSQTKNYMHVKLLIVTTVFILAGYTTFSQSRTVISPNKKVSVDLSNDANSNTGGWYLKVRYSNADKTSDAIERVALGISRSDQDFTANLSLIKTGKPVLIKDEYTTVHGKRLIRSNAANELTASFETPSKAKMNVIIRAYNDGVAFRYEFPESTGSFVVKDELTSYTIANKTKRWMVKWNPANEGTYAEVKADESLKQEWCYPALFQASDSSCFYLLHEADVNRTYCGTKLSNAENESQFKLTFPDKRDGRGKGESTPSITLPWKSPWRVIIVGGLADIVESTLVDDVSPPSTIKNTAWIKPGVASWNYWSNNHGTKDYKVVCAFADLAADMGWPYTLLDWEWDMMSNGGNLEDALKYIHSKGVTPLIWYNSGGDHTWVPSTPKDRMLTHEARTEEFAKLKKLGIAGVKVDFFESEKQDMIKYYLDIVEDAAAHEMMVYFHGCLVPRGWARTYPNLMTYEGVKGAEWYNNIPTFTMEAPRHNTILPFTRNVVGSMDYTPVTFTNSQHPHITSYGHELALSIVFESALQHMADRPQGYQELSDPAKDLLREVPTAWDDTKFIDGYPGSDITIARRKNDRWYIGGISGEFREKKKSLRFDFLPEGTKYKLTLISDGIHDKTLAVQHSVVDRSSVVDVRMLRRGGFAAILKPVR
jgi:alpha-glucosidase